MVDGARLESVYRGDSIVGSNPTVSAIKSLRVAGAFLWLKRVRVPAQWFEVGSVSALRQAQGSRKIVNPTVSTRIAFAGVSHRAEGWI